MSEAGTERKTVGKHSSLELDLLFQVSFFTVYRVLVDVFSHHKAKDEFCAIRMGCTGV